MALFFAGGFSFLHPIYNDRGPRCAATDLVLEEAQHLWAGQTALSLAAAEAVGFACLVATYAEKHF